MKALVWLINKLDGWKSIIAYVLMNLPFVTDNPMLGSAIKDFFKDPSNPNAWANLFVQALLAIGLFHKAIKELKKRGVL